MYCINTNVMETHRHTQTCHVVGLEMTSHQLFWGTVQLIACHITQPFQRRPTDSVHINLFFPGFFSYSVTSDLCLCQRQYNLLQLNDNRYQQLHLMVFLERLEEVIFTTQESANHLHNCERFSGRV